MATSSQHPGPPARAPRGFRVGVVRFVAAVIALTLIGIAAWGLRVSADVGRLVERASTAPTSHNLSMATFLLVWLFCFGPFLYFGVAILWSTFAPESHAWLAPLRLFNFIVGLRALAESRRRYSNDKSGEKALPASCPPEQYGPSSDSS